DLYYRLNVFPITVLSLQQRRQDLPHLVRYLVERLAESLRRRIDTIPDDAMRVLESHDWPGNVRELQNVLLRAIIGSRDGVLNIQESWQPSVGARESGERATLLEVERRHITRVLGGVRWRIEGRDGAAQILGMKASTLRSRMQRLGIVRPA